MIESRALAGGPDILTNARSPYVFDMRGCEALSPGFRPELSPDGSTIAFTGCGRLAASLYVADASGSDVRTIAEQIAVSPAAWSPDCTKIAFLAASGTGSRTDPVRFSIDIVNPDGSGLARVTSPLRGPPLWQPTG